MSFLVRRNLPKAWAGWRETPSQRSPGPLTPPWVHLGDGTPASFATSGGAPGPAASSEVFLFVPSNAGTVNAGGESYEFQPFTAHHGLDMEIWFPVEGAAPQSFAMMLTDTWSRVNGRFEDFVGLRMLRSQINGGDFAQLIAFEDPMTLGTELARWAPPVAWKGAWVSTRLWIDNDQFMRVWVNGVYLGGAAIPAGYRLHPGRRCMRFFNGAACNAWIRQVYSYDRQSSPPFRSRSWVSHFFDDFNRTNDSTVGNGWAEVGETFGVYSSSLAIPSGFPPAGHRYAWQSGNPSPTGAQRAEFVFGGSQSPTEQGSSPLLRMNAAGTVAIRALMSSTSISIQKITGATNLASPTITNLWTSSASISAGPKYAFSIDDDWAWVQDAATGDVVAMVDGIDAHSPATNRHYGAMCFRSGFTDSASFNEYRLLGAA